MKIEKSKFGQLIDGREVDYFSICNSKGMEIGIINYGAIIQKLLVPDLHGNLVDAVLGFEEIESY